MTRLYELAAEYAALQDAASDGEDVEAALDALQDELAVKADRVAHVLRGLDADDDAMTAEIKRMTARRDAVRRNSEKLHAYILQCMEGAGVLKLKSATLSLTVGDSPERVEVVDESLVPSEFKKPAETVVRKAEILKAWRDHGEVVPGVEIKRSRILRVR